MIDHPWLIRQKVRDIEFVLYCHNIHCTSYGEPQVVPGEYETDTGWGEPDWLDCRDCGEELRDIEPPRDWEKE